MAVQGIHALDFSVDGEFLALGTTDRMLRIWDVHRALPPWFLRGERPPEDAQSLEETGEM